MDEDKILMELLELRRTLHRNPEVAGEESGTAARIREFLLPFRPDRIIENIGGHGMIAEFRGKSRGPAVMFRCELDALEDDVGRCDRGAGATS